MCDNKNKSNFPEAFDSGAVLKQTSTTTWFGTNDVRDLSTPDKWPKTVVRVTQNNVSGEVIEFDKVNVRKQTSLIRRVRQAQLGWAAGWTHHVEIRDFEKKQ